MVTVSAVDEKTISFKQESLVKTSEFSCQLGVPFDETSADGRKVILHKKIVNEVLKSAINWMTSIWNYLAF